MFIAVSSGSGQSTTVGTAFAAALVAIVKDGSGNPVRRLRPFCSARNRCFRDHHGLAGNDQCRRPRERHRDRERHGRQLLRERIDRRCGDAGFVFADEHRRDCGVDHGQQRQRAEHDSEDRVLLSARRAGSST